MESTSQRIDAFFFKNWLPESFLDFFISTSHQNASSLGLSLEVNSKPNQKRPKLHVNRAICSQTQYLMYKIYSFEVNP